jgi:hypothetical protein
MSPWATLGPPPFAPLAQGERVYALIDGAQVAGLGRQLPRLRGVERSVPVFGNELSADRADATPHVLLMADLPSCQRLVGSDAMQTVSFPGALSWLVSPLALDELAHRLLRRTDARLPDQFDCVNRFFDGRVVPHLHEALTSTQRDAYFSLATQWWVVSTTHQWQALPSRCAAVDPHEPPLVLDERQQAELIDACYPYSVIEHFMLTDPELLDTVPPPQRYAFVSGALRKAGTYGIDGGSSAILFCTLTLTRGPDFHQQTAWQDALQRVKRGEITLQQAVRAQHD